MSTIAYVYMIICTTSTNVRMLINLERDWKSVKKRNGNRCDLIEILENK